jgi:hypothetical protein
MSALHDLFNVANGEEEEECWGQSGCVHEKTVHHLRATGAIKERIIDFVFVFLFICLKFIGSFLL